MKKSSVLVIASLIAGGAIGSGVTKLLDSGQPLLTSDQAQIRQGQFKFTNPLLECELGYLISEKKFATFRKEVTAFVNEEKAKGEVTDFAVYYRDLNNGPWFGIDEREAFIPASLLKLPLAMAFYKEVEHNPALLTEKIEYEGTDIIIDQHFDATESLKAGEIYELGALVDHMLVHSDNEAALIIFQYIGADKAETIYNDLALPVPMDGDYTISVKNYGAFFRLLFNASYLTEEHSDHILSTLSQIDFKEGIRKGVPDNIIVSHKFGESQNTQGEKSLHDCGIIYGENNPYLLCVMTKGKDFDRMSESITRVSKIIYEKIGAN